MLADNNPFVINDKKSTYVYHGCSLNWELYRLEILTTILMCKVIRIPAWGIHYLIP